MTRAQVIREMKKAERVEERRALAPKAPARASDRNHRGLAASQPKPFRGPVLARPAWFDEPDIKSKLVLR